MKSKGFTLIELLVVIAIIGLLTTTAVVSLNSARLKSRDARRISDIKQVQTALEMWFNDNQAYPDALVLDGTASIATTANVYMSKSPADPLNIGNYTYDYYPCKFNAVGGGYICGIGNTPVSSYQLIYNLEGTINGISGRATATPGGIKNN